MNAAGSKVSHSAVSSSALCCRPLLPLGFLPLPPPPLLHSGFLWAVVNKYAQVIAKADFYPCGNLHSRKENIFSVGSVALANSHRGWQ